MILEALLDWRSARIGAPYHPSRSGVWGSNADTSTGIPVTELSSIENTPVWAALMVISGALASLPLLTFQRRGDDHVRAPAHPLYPLLRYQPNPESVAIVFRQAQIVNRLLWGNSYYEISRDATARPTALWHLPSWLVTPRRFYKKLGGGLTEIASAATPEDRARGGTIVYEVQDGHGGRVFIEPHGIGHSPYVSLNGVVGLSPIAAHRQSIALGLAMQRSAASIFGNGAVPLIALERPKEAPELSPEGEANLIAAWEASHQGPMKRGRTAVLQEGTQAKAIQVPLNELQFIENLRHQIPEVARIFNIAAYFLGHDGSQNTYSNVEGEWTRLVRQTLTPLMEADTQEIYRKLVHPDEATTIFAEYETKGFLKGDTAARGQYLKTMYEIGALSRGETARVENLPPVPPEQDGYYKASEHRSPAPSRGMSPELAGRLRAMFAAGVQRVVNREVREIRRAVERAEGSIDAFKGWVETFYDRDLVEFAASVAAPALGAEATTYARRYAAEHRSELRRLIDERAGAPAVVALLDAWTADAPGREADREIDRLIE